ncbi:hypothetical protein PRZ61_12255 [Halomonas pacifica]|uniref:DUF6631 family protein n=1 Tax=Bisbaumannia pacifica TaxID=77098 RepID=UPI00235A3D3A|nr:DUF6631 family protein [Halomonas pacifica]MDC8804214.1 hypothetical protein [Halomonas pacifica]
MTDQTESDAEVLFPDVALTLSTGEQVTVREFRYLEGLEVAALARPLFERIIALHAAGQGGQQVLEVLLLEHRDLVSTLMAMACDRGAEWVAGLSDSDGMAIVGAFWRANSGFFMRRLALHLGMERTLEALLEILCPSPSSSTGSSQAATDATPSTSPAD